MMRLPDLLPDKMTPEQRQIHEEIVAGPRGRIIGPLRAAIYNPELARRWSPLGEYLRFKAKIGTRLTELAILVVARRWRSEVEWWIHSELATGEGIDHGVIDAIRRGTSPVFEREADAEVYEFTRQLQLTGFVEDGLYHALRARHGHVALVDLTAVIGYYTMVSITLNAHEIGTPDNIAPAFRNHRLGLLDKAVTSEGEPWQWAADPAGQEGD